MDALNGWGTGWNQPYMGSTGWGSQAKSAYGSSGNNTPGGSGNYAGAQANPFAPVMNPPQTASQWNPTPLGGPPMYQNMPSGSLVNQPQVASWEASHPQPMGMGPLSSMGSFGGMQRPSYNTGFVPQSQGGSPVPQLGMMGNGFPQMQMPRFGATPAYSSVNSDDFGSQRQGSGIPFMQSLSSLFGGGFPQMPQMPQMQQPQMPQQPAWMSTMNQVAQPINQMMMGLGSMFGTNSPQYQQMGSSMGNFMSAMQSTMQSNPFAGGLGGMPGMNPMAGAAYGSNTPHYLPQGAIEF